MTTIKRIFKGVVFYAALVMFMISVCISTDSSIEAALAWWFATAVVIGVAYLSFVKNFADQDYEEIKKCTGINFDVEE